MTKNQNGLYLLVATALLFTACGKGTSTPTNLNVMDAEVQKLTSGPEVACPANFKPISTLSPVQNAKHGYDFESDGLKFSTEMTMDSTLSISPEIVGYTQAQMRGSYYLSVKFTRTSSEGPEEKFVHLSLLKRYDVNQTEFIRNHENREAEYKQMSQQVNDSQNTQSVIIDHHSQVFCIADRGQMVMVNQKGETNYFFNPFYTLTEAILKAHQEEETWKAERAKDDADRAAKLRVFPFESSIKPATAENPCAIFDNDVEYDAFDAIELAAKEGRLKEATLAEIKKLKGKAHPMCGKNSGVRPESLKGDHSYIDQYDWSGGSYFTQTLSSVQTGTAQAPALRLVFHTSKYETKCTVGAKNFMTCSSFNAKYNDKYASCHSVTTNDPYTDAFRNCVPKQKIMKASEHLYVIVDYTEDLKWVLAMKVFSI